MGQAADISLRSQPHKYLDEPTLAFLKHLSFSARGSVDGTYTGKHKSLLKGHSQEFTDYREYLPGDDIRKIDWKAYGRTDRYVIKLSEQETVMTCHLLVDCSASMAFGGSWHEKFFGAGDVSKYDYACYLGAALSYLLLKQGDRVSLTLFGSEIEQHVPAGGAFTHFEQILHALQVQKVCRKTCISKVLQQTSSLLKRRGILIVISDLLDDPEALFGVLDMYLHRSFEIVLFHVLHKHELELPSLASVNFIDSESGEKLTSVPDDIRQMYSRELQQYMDTIVSMAEARRIDYELMSTATPYPVALQGYVQRRRRCRFS
ncbi:MAG: DUF58 domain-containing protein [Sedimentisphaerales bacterium]|nr:DUF58 domain-containing protein [Sedimentisphaerales bacterium]